MRQVRRHSALRAPLQRAILQRAVESSGGASITFARDERSEIGDRYVPSDESNHIARGNKTKAFECRSMTGAWEMTALWIQKLTTHLRSAEASTFW
jgi:hypothetical protein